MKGNKVLIEQIIYQQVLICLERERKKGSGVELVRENNSGKRMNQCGCCFKEKKQGLSVTLSISGTALAICVLQFNVRGFSYPQHQYIKVDFNRWRDEDEDDDEGGMYDDANLEDMMQQMGTGNSFDPGDIPDSDDSDDEGT